MTGDHDVRIRLVPDGRITGRIVIAGLDTPPTDVRVHLWPAPPALIRRDGSFEIAEIPPGTYDPSFDSPDFLSFQRAGVEVRSGETTELGTLTAARGRILVGRVVDSNGAPSDGARVEVGVIRLPPVEIDDPPAGFHAYRTGASAADGTFRIYHVPPAPMVVVASTKAGGSSEPVPVPGGPDTPGDPPPVTLVLSPSHEPREETARAVAPDEPRATGRAVAGTPHGQTDFNYLGAASIAVVRVRDRVRRARARRPVDGVGCG